MHFVSHCILSNFISIQQPEIFCKLQSVYRQINYILHANMQKCQHCMMSNAFAFLSNLLQNHVTLASLVMVGPGKLIWQGTGPSRPGSGYTTEYTPSQFHAIITFSLKVRIIIHRCDCILCILVGATCLATADIQISFTAH